MRVNEEIPNSYRIRKYCLGPEYNGRRVTWSWIIKLGLEKAEELVAKDGNGLSLHHQAETE